MYRNQPWTVEDASTKKKQSKRESNPMSNLTGTEKLKSLLLNYAKKNPSMIFDANDVAKVLGCSRGVASRVVLELYNSKKIKLVRLYKNRAMLFGGFQSLNGDLDAIKVVKNKSYKSITPYLRTQGITNPETIAAVRKILEINDIQPNLTISPSNIFTLVYTPSDLKSALKTFRDSQNKKVAKNKVAKRDAQKSVIKTVKTVAASKEVNIEKESPKVKEPLTFKFFGKTISINIQ